MYTIICKSWLLNFSPITDYATIIKQMTGRERMLTQSLAFSNQLRFLKDKNGCQIMKSACTTLVNDNVMRFQTINNENFSIPTQAFANFHFEQSVKKSYQSPVISL